MCFGMKRLIFKYIGVFLLLIASFFAFAVVSCCWPDRAVRRHVSQAAVTLQGEEVYRTAFIDRPSCQQDNFSEAIILNQIFCVNRRTPVNSAMGVYRSYNGPDDMAGALLSATRLEPDLMYIPYARYWHGSTFLFRILLSLMSYSQLQWLLFAASTLLMLLFVCVYYPKAGIWKTLAFLSSWTLVYGYMMQFSMQFFPAFALALAASILIVRHERESPYIAMLFFIIACLTNYFDLFTVPLLTFGWPLVAWLSIQDNRSVRLKDTSLSILTWGALWGAGYGLTFLSKWALASLTLKENILRDGIGQSLYRMSLGDHTRWDAVVHNVQMLPTAWACVCLIILLVVTIPRFRGNGGPKALLFLLIALLPYIWYLLVPNHCVLHFWFTYRLQAISLSALFMAVLSFRADPVRHKW